MGLLKKFRFCRKKNLSVSPRMVDASVCTQTTHLWCGNYDKQRDRWRWNGFKQCTTSWIWSRSTNSSIWLLSTTRRTPWMVQHVCLWTRVCKLVHPACIQNKSCIPFSMVLGHTLHPNVRVHTSSAQKEKEQLESEHRDQINELENKISGTVTLQHWN